MMKGGLKRNEAEKLKERGTGIKGMISNDKKKGQHWGKDWKARDNQRKKGSLVPL